MGVVGGWIARLTGAGATPTGGGGDDFEALFEAIREPAALVDGEGRVAAANPALRDLLGPPSTLSALMPADRLFAADAREAALRWMAGGGGGAPFEALLVAPEGVEPPVVACRLRVLPGGRRLLLAEDLSERRRFRARAEEGERLRAVGQLAGGIAHDVNNLLNVVVAAAEAVRRDCPAVEGPDLEALLDAAARGAALVGRLLAFAGRQRLEPRVVVLDEALEGMRPLLRPLLGGGGLRLEVTTDAPGRAVRVDLAQLGQVVLNLAANAKQAMPRGGCVSLSTGTAVALREEAGMPDPLPPGRYVVLSVADTGGGIAPEVLPRVFEPFFTTRAAEGGTGLGLATVHGIVRQSGGALQVSTRPGQGTTFRVYLPRHDGGGGEEAPAAPGEAALGAAVGAVGAAIADAPVLAAGAEPPGGEAPEGTTAGGPDSGRSPTEADAPSPSALRVLLVDDEAPLRRLIERALLREGFDVAAAEDAEDALGQMAGGLEPDVLVSDVAMPGMDGLALAREARARRPGLPVVLVSGYAESALKGAPLDPGIAFLAKPYRPAHLAEAVRAVARAGSVPAAAMASAAALAR